MGRSYCFRVFGTVQSKMRGDSPDEEDDVEETPVQGSEREEAGVTGRDGEMKPSPKRKVSSGSGVASTSSNNNRSSSSNSGGDDDDPSTHDKQSKGSKKTVTLGKYRFNLA